MSPQFRLLILALLSSSTYLCHSKLLDNLDKVDSLELRHIFGSDYHNYLHSHAVEYPTKTQLPDGSILIEVPYQEDLYQFIVSDQDTNLLSPGFHTVYKDNYDSKLHVESGTRKCVYRGESISHASARLALVGCGSDMRGMMTLGDGDYVFINPAPLVTRVPGSELSNKQAHVLHKRSAPSFSTEAFNHANVTCLFDERSDPYANRTTSAPRPDVLPVMKDPLNIEVGLFVDDRLWDHFKQIYAHDADRELENFIIATVNNINLMYNQATIEPKAELKIVRYEVLKTSPSQLRPNEHRNGDVDLLLDAFCLYQQNLNTPDDNDPKHWDHALLFTGYDLYRGAITSVAGYAPVKGMCSGIRSCTINEGMDFGSIFVITHEMGHSLGMYHDGDNGCESVCCIMSPSLGSGKTHWSRCSTREFNTFFNDLGAPEMPPQCLLDGADDPIPLDFVSDGTMPGQRYNLNQQCRIFHGDCWHHELRESQIMQDVCEMVWCGESEGVIRTAHPALEGSYCGENSWCVQGKCEPYGRVAPAVIHGAWTSWNDSPNKACGGECSQCKVLGQLSVRRSVRLCEKPAPNFGGKECPGSGYRATLCSPERCATGVRPEDYAIRKCTELRAKDGSGAGPPPTAGTTQDVGYQYREAPCKVWCQIGYSGFIRAVNSFPDGTPCGVDKYCVKGECMILSCNGKALVADPANCPGGIPAPSVDDWDSWSFWSTCSKSCGLGLQSRTRTCKRSQCVGASRQSAPCNVKACPSGGAWSEWVGWSTCSRTCGSAMQNRQRICTGRQCVGLGCNAASCDTGEQSRSRTCLNLSPQTSCSGSASESRPCTPDMCTDGSRPGNIWSEWDSWEKCTRDRNRKRVRRCLSTPCDDAESTQREKCS